MMGLIARVARCGVAALAVLVGCAAMAAAEKGAPAAPVSGPSFNLVDQTGRAVSEADFLGKPTVLHFGFTNCPVVCPTTLYEVSEILRQLGPAASDIQFVFVTVDPERDTAAVLKDYIASFDDRIIGLTGPWSEIEKMAHALGATAERIEQPDGGYEMAHTVFAYLFDGSWQRAGTLYMGTMNRPELVLKRLTDLRAR